MLQKHIEMNKVDEINIPPIILKKPKVEITQGVVDKIIELYVVEGLSSHKVARQLDLPNEGPVLKVLKENGYAMHPHHNLSEKEKGKVLSLINLGFSEMETAKETGVSIPLIKKIIEEKLVKA